MGNNIRIRAQVQDQASGSLAKMRDEFDRLGKSKGFMSVAQGVGMGAGFGAWNMLADGIGNAIGFMADSVTVASDLNEAVSKSGVIFGDATGAIDEFAETSARNFGISKRAAYDAAGSFGNLFTTMGYGQEAAADMSVDITKLASDLASFHNIGIEDALDKLRSGLVGEAEPMRALGVLLNEATVNAKGLEMGLGDANEKLSETEKVTARYQLILDQTGAAQGDFARTSDGLANVQRSLQAEVEDLQADIGEALLPVMRDLAIVVRDGVVPALSVLAGALNMVMLTTEDTDRVMKQGRARIANLTAGVREAGEAAADMSAGLLIGRSAVVKLADKLGDAEDAAADAARELGEFEGAVNDALDALIESSLGPEQLRLKLRGAKDELIDNRKELRELEKIKDPTRDQQADIRDLKLRVSEGKEEVIRLSARLTMMGELTTTQLRRQIERLEVGLGDAKDEADALFDALNRLPGVITPRTSGGGSWGGIPGAGRAEGGPVSPDSVYVVGEKGPELFVPHAAGTIIPNEQSFPALVPTMRGAPASAPSGAPVVIQLQVDGQTLAEIVDRRLYFAASVAPVSAR